MYVKIDWVDNGNVPTCLEDANECMHVRILDDTGAPIYTFDQLPDPPVVTEHAITLPHNASYTLELKSHWDGGLTVWLNARRKVSAVEREAGGYSLLAPNSCTRSRNSRLVDRGLYVNTTLRARAPVSLTTSIRLSLNSSSVM